MKIIAKSNFDNETVSERLVAEGIRSKIEATLMCNGLNSTGGDYSADFYKVEEDDYKLYELVP